jgi:hypothetical protein
MYGVVVIVHWISAELANPSVEILWITTAHFIPQMTPACDTPMHAGAVLKHRRSSADRAA